MIAGLANASRVSSAVEVSSVFVPFLSDEHGWSRTTIASATTIGGVAVAIAGPFVGNILDRYGPRLVVPLGAALTGIGCILLAGIDSAPFFIGIYALVRLSGQAFVQFPNQVTVAKWFNHKRGRASALLVGLGSVGLITAPMVVTSIIVNHGLSSAWIALGVLALGLGVLPTLILGARRPEDVGLVADGELAKREDSQTAGTGDGFSGDWMLADAIRTPALWLIAGSGILYSMSSTGVGFHQLAYYVEQGMATNTAAAIVSMFAVGLTVGGIFWGILADKVSIRALIALQYLLATFLQLSLLFSDTPKEAFLISFSLGALVGGALSLPTLLLASYYGRGHLGSIAGILQMTRGVSLGAGPIVAAVIYDLLGGYEPAFLGFSLFCGSAFGMMLVVRRPVIGSQRIDVRTW